MTSSSTQTLMTTSSSSTESPLDLTGRCISTTNDADSRDKHQIFANTIPDLLLSQITNNTNPALMLFSSSTDNNITKSSSVVQDEEMNSSSSPSSMSPTSTTTPSLHVPTPHPLNPTNPLEALKLLQSAAASLIKPSPIFPTPQQTILAPNQLHQSQSAIMESLLASLGNASGTIGSNQQHQISSSNHQQSLFPALTHHPWLNNVNVGGHLVAGGQVADNLNLLAVGGGPNVSPNILSQNNQHRTGGGKMMGGVIKSEPVGNANQRRRPVPQQQPITTRMTSTSFSSSISPFSPPPSSSSSTPPSPNGSTSASSPSKKTSTIPDEKKDDLYWERRRKNNEAAKRSRDSRRRKEEEVAMKASILEQENLKLRAQVAILKNETAKLHLILFNNATAAPNAAGLPNIKPPASPHQSTPTPAAVDG